MIDLHCGDIRHALLSYIRRHASGLVGYRIAEEAGINRSTYRKIMQGADPLSFEKADKIIAAIDRIKGFPV